MKTQIFRSLRYRNFKLFFYGQTISLIGTWMQKTAVSWLVYRLTGSAVLLGTTVFASLIPSLILSPFAGSYIDRHDRFKVLLTTQIASMVQAGSLALLIFLKIYNIPAIVLLSLMQGVINAFDVTCRQSLLVEMVEDKDDLPNAIALNSTMANFARIAGPAAGGIILSTFGEDFCFFSNFLSYLPVLACLFMMRLNLKEVVKPDTSIWVELKEGFQYVTGDRELSSLIVMIGITSLFVIPFNTLMPIFAKDLFNGTAGTFSWFESMAGLGSIISAIYLANLKPGKNMIRIMSTASVVSGASLLFLSCSRSLPPALFFMGLSGVGLMAHSSAINTYIQTHAAPAMRARAISYYVMAYQGLMPVGSLLAGYMSQQSGPRTTVFAEGAIGIAAVAAFKWYRSRQSALPAVIADKNV